MSSRKKIGAIDPASTESRDWRAKLKEQLLEARAVGASREEIYAYVEQYLRKHERRRYVKLVRK